MCIRDRFTSESTKRENQKALVVGAQLGAASGERYYLFFMVPARYLVDTTCNRPVQVVVTNRYHDVCTSNTNSFTMEFGAAKPEIRQKQMCIRDRSGTGRGRGSGLPQSQRGDRLQGAGVRRAHLVQTRRETPGRIKLHRQTDHAAPAFKPAGAVSVVGGGTGSRYTGDLHFTARIVQW